MPAEAVLCGTDVRSKMLVYYYKTSRPQKEVMDGFIAAFKAAGWKTDNFISERMNFNNGILPGNPGSKNGSLGYNVQDVDLTLSYREE